TLVQSIGYNAAGGVKTIRTRGEVETVITPDVRNRPASITVKRMSPTPVITHLDTGTYAYDGAGNITQMGVDRFAYDLLNRLVKGSVYDSAGSKTESLLWEYDNLGNMLRQWRAPLSGTSSADSRFTMNLARNQIQSYRVDRTGLPSDPDANT